MMPQDRGHRRKHSRSASPVASKQKRSWQNRESERPPPRPAPQRSPSPPRRDKSKPTFGSGARSRLDSPPLLRAPLPPPRRSLSPVARKRHSSRSPESGRRGPQSPVSRGPPRDGPRDLSHSGPRDGPAHQRKDGSRDHVTRQRQRSFSPRPQKKMGNDRVKPGSSYLNRTPTPERGFHGNKKKSRMSSVSPPPPTRRTDAPPSHHHSHHHSDRRSTAPTHKPVVKRRPVSRSLSPLPPPTSATSSSRGGAGSGKRSSDHALPQRRVSSSSKKKGSPMTLHRRFTTDDQEPFRLEDNVTIAILRNPNAEPSEEVTVKRVFDSSLFKMIHKKAEGKRPIFDREEIRVWRHDDNLADDPDFERRLVRVKSSNQGKERPGADSLSRMSPDVIRKAFGLQAGGRRSKSRSPHREPQIRLDPRPDPRYESKYRKQLEKEKEDRRNGGGSSGGGSATVSSGEKERRRVDDSSRRSSCGGGDAYDLRHALERRRNDREDGGFKSEVYREEVVGRPSDRYSVRPEGRRGRGSSPDAVRRRMVEDSGDGGSRNVVFSGGKSRHDSPVRSWGEGVERGGRTSFRGSDSARGWGRGATGGRGARHTDWGSERDNFRGRERGGSVERRTRYSHSPPAGGRGWRGGHGVRGRGRGRDFHSPYRNEIVSPTEIDDSFKYTQHDDRDLSPKNFRGRGGRGRFPARSFGSNTFRGARGAYRGRGFNGKTFGALRDARSSDHYMRDRSADREWKHDMYDSLQDDQPHSTTMNG